jgi:hypothetical protein
MRKLTLLILLATFAARASAQASHEKTMQLFSLMELDKTMSSMTDNMMVMFTKTAGLNPDDKISKDYMAYVSSEVKQFSTRMINEMIPLYENYFTADEMQKYIDFYSTPAGKKLIESGPVLQQKMMTTMMTKDLPELQAKFQKKLEELQGKQ